MKVNLVVPNKNDFEITNTIIFKTNISVKGGNDFLDNIKKDLNIKDKKENEKVELKKNTEIDDIMLFKEDYFIDIKNKISTIIDIPSHKLLLFDDKYQILDFEYLLDGILIDLDPKELLREYKEEYNVLYKYKGSYEFIDHTYHQVGPYLKGIINVLSIDNFITNNALMEEYYKKFWPFYDPEDKSQPFDYNYWINETKMFNKILDTKARSTIYSNSLIGFYNKYGGESINLGNILSNLNLNDIEADYAHIYDKKHIFKYFVKYKVQRSFDFNALNIVFSQPFKFTLNIYPNSKVRVVTNTYNKSVEIVRSDLVRFLPILLKKIGIKILVEGKFCETCPLDASSKALFIDNLDMTIKYNGAITNLLFNNLSDINNSFNFMINSSEKLSNRYVLNIHKNTSSPYTLTITNEYTKLLFNIKNANFLDIEFLNNFITCYIFMINPDSSIQLDINSINKNKRLHERDPIAYPKKLKWARLCQNQCQPIIYNEFEYNNLEPKIKKECTKYFNFTTEEPAYYYCAHPKFPHIGFKSINDIGLPCCQQRSFDRMSKDKQEEHLEVLKTHVYIKTESKISSRYEMRYGKIIAIDRLVKLPLFFEKWLVKNKVQLHYDYKIVGVTQSFGLLGCYLSALDLTINDIKETWIKDVINGEPIFNVKEWNKKIIAHFFSVNIILIKDKIRDNNNHYLLDNNIVDISKPFMVVMRQTFNKTHYYNPIYGIIIKQFNKSKSIEKKLFDKDEFFVKNLIVYNTDNLLDKIRYLGWEIEKTFIYDTLILYILLKFKNDYVLFPLNHQILRFDVFENESPKSYNLPIKTLLFVLNELNIRPDIQNILINKDGLQIGFVANDLVYHHNPIKVEEEFERIYINYDIYDIYKNIYQKNPPLIEYDVKPIIKKFSTIDEAINDFRDYILSYKNDKIRDKIRSIYESNKKETEKLIEIYQLVGKEDYYLIKDSFDNIQNIMNKVYKFDNLELHKLTEMEINDIIKHLKKKYNEEISIYFATILKNKMLLDNFISNKIEVHINTIIKHKDENVIVI